MHSLTRTRLMVVLAAAGLIFLLGTIPVNAQTTVVLDPSSSGTISTINNGTGTLDVVFPNVLSGTGYAFDSGGTGTSFNIGSTLSTFASSDQATTLSLGGGTPTPVTWVDMGGGTLPGIVVLQFTTPLQSTGAYDYLILNINSIYEPYLASALPCSLDVCDSSAEPAPANYNLCAEDASACVYNSLVDGGGSIVTSYYACGMFDLSSCVGGTSPNPITSALDISSGLVYLGTPPPTPEPSSFLLMGGGMLALGSILRRRRIAGAKIPI
jgi:hypothetical protein